MSAICRISISTRIHWIETPGADLRIPCGCPADSVRHLLNRGLIVSEEVKGVKAAPEALLMHAS